MRVFFVVGWMFCLFTQNLHAETAKNELIIKNLENGITCYLLPQTLETSKPFIEIALPSLKKREAVACRSIAEVVRAGLVQSLRKCGDLVVEEPTFIWDGAALIYHIDLTEKGINELNSLLSDVRMWLEGEFFGEEKWLEQNQHVCSPDEVGSFFCEVFNPEHVEILFSFKDQQLFIEDMIERHFSLWETSARRIAQKSIALPYPFFQFKLVADEEYTHSFYSLPISDKEREIIGKIIKTMANDSVFKLLWKKKEMERLGDKLDNVHPLRFLGHVFSSPKLKSCMHKISHSHFKWDGFMGGLGGGLDKKFAQNDLLNYLPGFAQHLKVSEEDLASFLHSADWDGLVIYLMNH